MKKRTGVKNAVWALALVTLLLGGCGSKADRSSATAADMETAEEAAYDAAGTYLSDDIYSVDPAENEVVADDVAEDGAARGYKPKADQKRKSFGGNGNLRRTACNDHGKDRELFRLHRRKLYLQWQQLLWKRNQKCVYDHTDTGTASGRLFILCFRGVQCDQPK